MMSRLLGRTAAALFVAVVGWPSLGVGQTQAALPSPFRLVDVVRIAGERRAEIDAARARTRAAEQRPVIVSALQEPMVSPSLDHLPFMWSGADVSVTIEQQIPRSGIRSHRRASALADIDRLRAETGRAGLDVGLQAATAFLMLQHRQRTQALLSGPGHITTGNNPTAASAPRPARDAPRRLGGAMTVSLTAPPRAR